ncbi:MAG: amino acid permease [Candidatus Nitrosotalea sp.]|nr:amino acid permease [Candidatus Nitrosotalea sp.]
MSETPKLKRNLGLLGVSSLGIANIIGAGIFVISGVAAGLAGPSVIFSFLIAGSIALMAALSYAELSSFIHETGASYAFTKRAFGRFWSFVVGWFNYFDYIVGAAAVSIGFAAYFTELFGLQGGTALILSAVGLPIVLMILNLIGVKEATHVTMVMVFIKIFALVLLIMVGGLYISTHLGVLHYHPFFPNGFGGTLSGSAIIFFAFLGFNTVAMMSEETKNPQKTIPRALLLAFFVSFVLYIGIAVVEVGILDWKIMGNNPSPLATLASTISHNEIFLDIISFSAIVATGSVVLSSIIGGTRASYVMGRDGVLPQKLDAISKKFGTPYVSILLGGSAIAVLAGIFFKNIDTIASIYNFGSLLTYIFVHLSILKLRKKEPQTIRSFKVPLYPILPIIGLVCCVALIYYLSNTAKMASLAWGLIGLAVYFGITRLHKTKTV